MESKLIIIEEIFKKSWKSFILGFAMVTIMQIANLLNFHPFSEFVSPLGRSVIQSIDTMEEIIRPKLERIKNDYFLKSSASGLVPQASASFEIHEAPAYILVDFDSGQILLEKNKNTQLPIASLTKIMTAVVTLDLAEIDESFIVTDTAASQIPTKIGVVPGQKMTVLELLNASLLTSANDATQLLHDGIDKKYGGEFFIKSMNEKAKIIGLKNTSFTNVQGFDNRENYSTVEDLAILSHYAMENYPQIREIVKKDYEFLPENSDHKQFDLHNWNGLMGVYPNISGFKIGNTGRAGKTTAVVAEREGKKMLVIVLGAPGLFERDLWAASLLDYGYQTTMGLSPIEVTHNQLQEKYNSWN